MTLASIIARQCIPLMPRGPLSENQAIINANIHEDIPKLVAGWGCRRIVLVVSKTLAKEKTTVEQLQKSLGDKVVATKIGVGSHTPYADVLDIAGILQQTSADLLVCIGSSSYSDACKIARLLAASLPIEQLTVQGIDTIMDHERGRTKRGSLSDPLSKLILVPCTLSASEYNPVGSATHPSGKKEHFGDGFEHRMAAAEVVLLDPDVAATVPARVWLESGARAVDHCIESMVSKATVQEGIDTAREALADLVAGLGRYKMCYEANSKADATALRGAISNCQAGARLAISTIMCYGSKMGPSHAIGHQLGSVGRVAHGLTSCVCLPGVLQYEARHPSSEFWDTSKHSDVIAVLNHELGWVETEASTAVEKFYRSLGLPTRLHEVGVTSDQALEQIARQTLSDIWGGGEPQLTTTDQVLEVLNNVR